MVGMAIDAPQIDSPETVQGNCLMGNLGWMLDQANHALGCEVAAALAPLDLGQRGFCVLSAAVDAELTQTELSGMIGLDKTTMVVTVDDLERKGLRRARPVADRPPRARDQGHRRRAREGGGGAADRPGASRTTCWTRCRRPSARRSWRR